MDATRRRLLRLVAATLGATGLLAACSRMAGGDTAAPTATTSTGAGTSTTPTTTGTTMPSPTTTTTGVTPAIAGPVPLTVIGREGWTDRPRGTLRRHTIERITIHHTASYLEDNRRAPQLIRQHLDWHQSHDWPDIAYHFVIDRNGNVFEGRPVWAIGDTFTEYDPTGHFLACLEGNLDRQEPSLPQLAALTSLVAWAMQTHRVGPAHVTGHRDWARTSCPGDQMQWRLAGLARAAGDQGPIELVYLRDSDARAAVAEISAGA